MHFCGLRPAFSERLFLQLSSCLSLRAGRVSFRRSSCFLAEWTLICYLLQHSDSSTMREPAWRGSLPEYIHDLQVLSATFPRATAQHVGSSASPHRLGYSYLHHNWLLLSLQVNWCHPLGAHHRHPWTNLFGWAESQWDCSLSSSLEQSFENSMILRFVLCAQCFPGSHWWSLRSCEKACDSEESLFLVFVQTFEGIGGWSDRQSLVTLNQILSILVWLLFQDDQ